MIYFIAPVPIAIGTGLMICYPFGMKLDFFVFISPGLTPGATEVTSLWDE
jgi:hypothetical protein